MKPTRFEGNRQALHLESVLQDLSLHHFVIDPQSSGLQLAHIFEEHLDLPGAILMDQEKFVGLISRYQFLELLIRPHGMVFLQEPLYVLYSYMWREMLLLAGDVPILTASRCALRRLPNLRHDPIAVRLEDGSYGILDVQELHLAYWQLRGIETQVRYERTQVQMIQSEKMASLGRLVDGVAHEILDPVSFIWGNLSHVLSYSQDLLHLVAAYEEQIPNPPLAVANLKADLELEYLREDLPRTIASIQTGAERLSKLASSLQNFCHIDEVYPKPIDLHESLDSILLLLKSRLSSEIQVTRAYGALPPVLCYPGQLNQVFMNLLSYAVDALLNQAVSRQLHLDVHSYVGSPSLEQEKPTISLSTEVCTLESDGADMNRWVRVRIAHNGDALTPEQQQEITDSFTIKKRAEKETSLAMSYQIITARHGGKFTIETGIIPPESPLDAPRGTAFMIWLPLI